MYLRMSPISWFYYVYTVSDTSCGYINVNALHPIMKYDSVSMHTVVVYVYSVRYHNEC